MCIRDRVDIEERIKYPFKWCTDDEIFKGIQKLAKGDNLTPFQFLQVIAKTSNPLYVSLFREYYSVYRGTNQVNFSRGLREKLGLLEVDKKDSELCEVVESDEIVLHTMVREIWKVVCKLDKRGEVLSIASRGNKEELVSYIESLIIKYGSEKVDFSKLVDTAIE